MPLTLTNEPTDANTHALMPVVGANEPNAHTVATERPVVLTKVPSDARVQTLRPVAAAIEPTAHSDEAV